MLYITVSEDREPNQLDSTYTRLRISKNPENIQTDRPKEYELTEILEAKDERPLREIAKDFINQYGSGLSYWSSIIERTTEEMCFRNIDPYELIWYLGDFFTFTVRPGKQVRKMSVWNPPKNKRDISLKFKK